MARRPSSVTALSSDIGPDPVWPLADFTLHRKVLCMRDTIYLSTTADRPADRAALPTTAALRAPIGIAVAGTGLALGVAADSLFHDGIGAVAFALWIGLLTLSLV